MKKKIIDSFLGIVLMVLIICVTVPSKLIVNYSDSSIISNQLRTKTNLRKVIPSAYTFKTSKDGIFKGIIGWYDNFTLVPGTYYAIEKNYVNGSFDGFWKEKHDCNVKFEQAFIDSCGWGPGLSELNSKTFMVVTPSRNIDSRDYENLMGDNIYVYELTINDMMKPSINGTTNFVVNVNNMLSKEQILSHIKATDETDGAIPVVIDSATYIRLIRKLVNII